MKYFWFAVVIAIYSCIFGAILTALGCGSILGNVLLVACAITAVEVWEYLFDD
jgi:hypothetical protein